MELDRLPELPRLRSILALDVEAAYAGDPGLQVARRSDLLLPGVSRRSPSIGLAHVLHGAWTFR